MAHLPSLLNDVPGVQHALYADDITLWATQGSLGSIETCLQHAASIVDSYARGCGLECSPTKSEYVHLRPKPNDTTQIELTLCNRAIPERDEIRVLGLHTQTPQNWHHSAQTTHCGGSGGPHDPPGFEQARRSQEPGCSAPRQRFCDQPGPLFDTLPTSA